MPIETNALEYGDASATYRGYLAWDSAAAGPRPGVLIAHTWAGCGPFEQRRAVALAGLGYVALAADLYGGGVVGKSPEENANLMRPLLEDRTELQGRMASALAALRSVDSVDAERTAAIGYCFGGLCALDLARSGAAFQAAVSFHGLLHPPDPIPDRRVQAKILVLHGWDDPMAKPSEVEALAAELTHAGADWQIHAYGGTMHAFTNPKADNPSAGTVYHAQSDRRSWRVMRDFLAETFDSA